MEGMLLAMEIEELIDLRDRLIAAGEEKNRRIRKLEQLVYRKDKSIQKRDARLAAYRNSDPEVAARARNGQLYSFISRALDRLLAEDYDAARGLLVEALHLTPDELDDMAFKSRVREKERRRAGQINPTIRGPGTSALVRSRIRPSTRKRIFDRDGNRCLVCGHAGDERNPLSIDHIIPISYGGTNEDRNLQTLCHLCNMKKSEAESRPVHPPIDLEKYEIRLVPRTSTRFSSDAPSS